MQLVVDLMGGDSSPQILLNGCIKAIQKYPDLQITCIVKKGILNNNKPLERINFEFAEEVISANDNLLTITRRKNTSMVKAMNYVNENDFDGVISCGSTAAFVASSVFILKRVASVSRPGLMIDLPTINNIPTTCLDLGANVELSNQAFKELANIAQKYVQYNRGIKNPKISLLNIGEEEQKGTKQLKQLYQEFKEDPTYNFIGNIESRYLLNNESDIIICDGYSGNIALKACEGMGEGIFKQIKGAQKKSFRNKMGLLLLKPLFKEMYQNLDYNNYGGAILIGVKKIAIKAHGSSNATTLCSAIDQFVKISKSNFIKNINEEK